MAISRPSAWLGGFRVGYHAPGNAAQEVMGWDDYHFYRFEIGSKQYGLI